jgi:hypothetical protein
MMLNIIGSAISLLSLFKSSSTETSRPETPPAAQAKANTSNKQSVLADMLQNQGLATASQLDSSQVQKAMQGWLCALQQAAGQNGKSATGQPYGDQIDRMQGVIDALASGKQSPALTQLNDRYQALMTQLGCNGSADAPSLQKMLEQFRSQCRQRGCAFDEGLSQTA